MGVLIVALVGISGQIRFFAVIVAEIFSK